MSLKWKDTFSFVGMLFYIMSNAHTTRPIFLKYGFVSTAWRLFEQECFLIYTVVTHRKRKQNKTDYFHIQHPLQHAEYENLI